MAQSLGPATAWIMLALSDSPLYRKKWENAVRRNCLNFPDIDEAIAAVSGSGPERTKNLIAAACNLTAIVSSRNAHRASLPIAMFSNGTTIVEQHKDQEKGEDKTADKAKPTSSTADDKMETDADAKIFTFFKRKDSKFVTSVRYNNGTRIIKVKFLEEDIDGFDFSGRGLIVLYNKLNKHEFTFAGDFAPDQASEVVFHATFGTFAEDLSLLGQITSKKRWSNRKELGPSFLKMGTSEKRAQFSPIKMNYWAKLSQASQTDLLASNKQQVYTVPVIAGKRRCQLGEDFFALFDKLSDRPKFAESKSMDAIAANWNNMAKAIAEVLRAGGKLVMGSKKWYRVDDATYDKEPVASEILFITTNRGFLMNE